MVTLTELHGLYDLDLVLGWFHVNRLLRRSLLHIDTTVVQDFLNGQVMSRRCDVRASSCEETH